MILFLQMPITIKTYTYMTIDLYLAQSKVNFICSLNLNRPTCQVYFGFIYFIAKSIFQGQKTVRLSKFLDPLKEAMSDPQPSHFITGVPPLELQDRLHFPSLLLFTLCFHLRLTQLNLVQGPTTSRLFYYSQKEDFFFVQP